jgi:hypothetical protein
MFKWFQRSKQNQKLKDAFDKGRQTAQAFTEDLGSLMTIRFEPVFNGYLQVIQKQLNQCMTPTDVPPIIAARVEYNVFLENVDELRDQMTNEIVTKFSDWLDLSDQLQSRDLFMQLINVKVQDFCARLTDVGLERFVNMADALKVADDEWRATNAERSAKFPPDWYPARRVRQRA